MFPSIKNRGILRYNCEIVDFSSQPRCLNHSNPIALFILRIKKLHSTGKTKRFYHLCLEMQYATLYTRIWQATT
ncbi:hypothetical protein DOY81_006146, partial [Sarcophaga bullata]